jgi:hypothetical protein
MLKSILLITSLLTSSAFAELGKTYAESDYGSDFKSSVDSKQTLATWRNKDWRITDLFDWVSHKCINVQVTKISGDFQITKTEMDALAKKQGVSLEDWQPLGTLGEENANFYQTKDKKFVVELGIHHNIVTFLPSEELANYLRVAYSAKEALRKLRGQ